MAWTSLKDRLNDLPHVLAGPLLRQVTPNSVTVWFALRTQGKIKVIVYEGTTVLGSAERDGAPIGTNLFLAAVTVSLDTPLVEGKVYLYDAIFTWGGGGSTLSQSLLVATGAAADQFCYAPYTKPSFCLPPADLGKLRIFHGSCRKPHGEGPDALALLDGVIRDKAALPYERPQQLLLTGDQIYADDVADILLLMLNDAGETLLGWPELLPLPSPIANLGPLSATAMPSYIRKIALDYAKFTSDDLKSHLMSLGEFFAMYLFAWSDALWPANLPEYADVEAWVMKYVPASIASETKKAFKRQTKTINTELGFVKTYKSTISQVRRILANIPTYMICDDHEVTDDWNMTRRFCSQVYGTPLGVRIIQNGLVAFALCQAWGNRPDRFISPPATAGSALLDHFNDISVSGAPTAMASAYDQHSPAIQTLVGVHSDTNILSTGRVFHDGTDSLVNNAYVNSKSLRYDFHVEGPGHLVLVTDTRTWRAYPGSNNETHADFLSSYFNPSELTHQLHLDTPLKGRLLMVVLTTNAPPIRSFRFAANHSTLIDVGQNFPGVWDFVEGIDPGWPPEPPPSANPTADLGGAPRAIYKNDLLDSWEFPSRQLDRLIVQIDTLLKTEGLTQQVILLSGDVHSSFACRLAYWVERQRLGDSPGTQTTSQMVIAQLVSSALKNEKDDTRGQQRSGYKYAPKWLARRLVPDFEPEGYGGWNTPTPSSLATLQLNSGGITVIPKPDYRYRLDYLVTTETGQGAPPPPVLIPLNPPPSPADAAKAYAQAAAAQQKLYNSGAARAQIIGHNNIAELTFAWQASSKRAYHTLHWWAKQAGSYDEDKPTDKYAHYWSRYDVSLNPDDAAYPKLKATSET